MLPDVTGVLFDVAVSWGGDRFVIAYAPMVEDKVHLRVVGLRCDGEWNAL